MRGVRLLLVLTVLSASAGFAAAPAQAGASQHCQLIKGTLRSSPGLTDVPTSQTITLATRVTGCSRAGGSGLLVVTTGAARATCSTLTSAMQPTTATIVWHNGKSSRVALTFSSVPASPNRLVFSGHVLSGAGAGDRIDGGLHLISTSLRVVHSSTDPGQGSSTQVRQHVPLNGDQGCTVTSPLAAVKVASYQSLKFTSLTGTTSPAPAKGAQPGTSGQVTTTTQSPVSLALEALARRKAERAKRPVFRPHRRAVRSRVHKKTVTQSQPVAGDVGGSDSFLDPETLLGAVCIGLSVVLLIVLFVAPRRARRRRSVSRVRM